MEESVKNGKKNRAGAPADIYSPDSHPQDGAMGWEEIPKSKPVCTCGVVIMVLCVSWEFRNHGRVGCMSQVVSLNIYTFACSLPGLSAPISSFHYQKLIT